MGSMTQEYLFRFGGIRRLYGDKGLETFYHSHVAVIGLGGVGSWAVEALARSGIGEITLVDFDDVCISNTNRQIHALTANVGKMKSDCLIDRCLQINPELKIHSIDEPYCRRNEKLIFQSSYDCVIDATDDGPAKFDLLLACRDRNIPVIIAGVAGGRQDPGCVQVADLSETQEDQMLSCLRKRLRRRAGFPRKGSFHTPCVFSSEKPLYSLEGGTLSSEKPDDFRKPLDCTTGFGTSTMVTGSFGFMLASEALKALSAPINDVLN